MKSFTMETLVDFVDDALDYRFVITEKHIDNLMATLAANGVKRVIWAYYGDGHGGYHCPADIAGGVHDKTIDFNQNQWDMLDATYKHLGNPLRVATEAAHRYGLEVYAYFKPYETGVSMVLHEGSPQAQKWGKLPHIGGQLVWLDPFVAANPDLRIKRRDDDLWPGHETATITTIELTKRDDTPTRITRDDLQFWVSEDNYKYQPIDVDFGFDEVVRPSPRDVADLYGNVQCRKGDPVRVLRLTGLSLTQKFIAISTNFTDGEGDFTHAWDALLTCYDVEDRAIPGVYAGGTGIWFPHWENLKTGGMYYDTGRGPEAITLDEPQGHVRGGSAVHDLEGVERVRGTIAFSRGRNAYLPGALCESDPRVQDYWMQCLREVLDAGVDGVELRAENHSTHTDTPQDYGFNPCVLDKVDQNAPDMLQQIARVRGEAYTDFLRKANREIKARGKVMRVNLTMAWFRPEHERAKARSLAFPANIEFNWQQWIDEGLLDAAMLRIFGKPFESIFSEDQTAQAMIAACNDKGIPLTVNQYISGRAGLTDEVRRVRDDGRFAGFVFYEVWHYMRALSDGSFVIATKPEHTDEHEMQSYREHRARTGRYVQAAMAAIASEA